MKSSAAILKTHTMRFAFIFFFLFVVCLASRAVAAAGETISVTFGGKSIVLPVHPGLCPIRNGNPAKSKLFKWQQESQKKVGNKLLAFFADCDSVRKIRLGLPKPEFEKWAMVVGSLTKGREIIFTSLNRRKFLEAYERQISPEKMKKILKKAQGSVDRALREANKQIYGDENRVSVGKDVIDVGVLDVTDSVHHGIISSAYNDTGRMLVGLVIGATLIKGAPFAVYFYSKYKNENSIKFLLHESRGYSAALIHLNK